MPPTTRTISSSILFLKRLSDRFDEEVENAVALGVARDVALTTGTSTSSSSRSLPAGRPFPPPR